MIGTPRNERYGSSPASRKVLEARMRRRVGDDLRPQLLGDQSGQAFGQPHADAADALRPQADGRGEHQVGAIGLEQVDRADVGLEPALDQVDDVGQRFGGVAALRDQPADFFERPEHRVFVTHRHVSDAHRPSVQTVPDYCNYRRRARTLPRECLLGVAVFLALRGAADAVEACPDIYAGLSATIVQK